MSLADFYNLAVKENKIIEDKAQIEVLGELDNLLTKLAYYRKSWFKRRASSIKGIYLYGPVGRGKTYLIDLFYENVKLKRKYRVHYHQFMQEIDAELRRRQGQKDPIKAIAKEIGKNTKLLCLDEFMVHDIADAMILGELLKNLFAQKVVLVATSNTKPDNLYLNGLQRKRFLPAIELIKKNCNVLEIADNKDYRLLHEPLHSTFIYPITTKNEDLFKRQFVHFALNPTHAPIELQNRMVSCVARGDKCIWFDFENICNIPRSQLDYLEIAKRFTHVFISNLSHINKSERAKTTLFIKLIDVFYDQKVKLYILSEVKLDDLYDIEHGDIDFKRTISRLKEMQ